MSLDNNQNKIAGNVPEHVAITCDGNRRWAKKQGLVKMLGHRKGLENVEHLVESANELGIKYITLWLLSTENLSERPDEFKYMMDLGREFTNHFKKRCLEEKIRFKHVGRKDRLPQDIVDSINSMEEETKDFDGLTVLIALDYGGRDELVRAFKHLNSEGLEITEDNISACLDTAGIPDPALLIRTGGHVRLSGIYPWASTYAELYFTETLFPDFHKEELENALAYYSSVNRNFGK